MGWKEWFRGTSPLPVPAPVFNLPPQEAGALPRNLWTDLQARLAASEPLETQLPECYAFLLLVNRRTVRVERQNEILHGLERWLAATVTQVYQQHLQVLEQPEHLEARREQLRLTIRVVDELGLLVQRLLQEHWQLLHQPPPSLNQLLATYGLRVLELLRAMQRLCALRYQKLLPEQWVAANQVYFGLRQLNLHETALPPLLTLAGDEDRTVTPAGLYTSLQFFGLLDATTWPLSDVMVPDAYLRNLPQSPIWQADTGQVLEARQVISYADLNGPPRFQRLPVSKQGLILGLGELFTLLEQHQHQLQRQLLVGEAAQPTPAPLQHLPLSARLALVDRMLYRLQPHRRMYERQPRQNVFLRLGAAGFRHCPEYLRQMQGRPPANWPAGEPPPLEAWHLLDESLSGLRVTVHDYPGLPHLAIGQCLLFERLSGCFETIGYVQRLHRLEEHALELALVKLGQQPQAVALQDPTRLDELRWPGLLALSPQGEWVVALAPDLGLRVGTPLWLWREDGEKQMSRLGEQRLQSQDLALYVLKVQPLPPVMPIPAEA